MERRRRRCDDAGHAQGDDARLAERTVRRQGRDVSREVHAAPEAEPIFAPEAEPISVPEAEPITVPEAQPITVQAAMR
jgi:hypothetical protein